MSGHERPFWATSVGIQGFSKLGTCLKGNPK